MSTIKTLMLTILFSWAVIQVTAKPVSPETATQVAVNFLKEKISQGSFPAGTQANFSMIILSGKHQQASMYVFNLMDNAGFIIVSGNDATYPVLCYANHGCFSMQEKERPGGFSYMLDEYTRLLDAVEEGGIPGDEKTSAEWAHYLHGPAEPSRAISGVGPLLTTTWGQDCWYNAYCPPDISGDCGHALTGCVATAMGQLMRYYSYPETGTGSCTYTHPVYGTLTADFSATDYRWNEMGTTATGTSHDAIAELLFHCGVAALMNYGTSGSGAFEVNMQNALIEHFGYSPASSLVFSANYTAEHWNSILKNELDLARPVFMTGVDTTEDQGHAFICDGYSDDNYYHIDWGWENQYNGYFMINNLCPGNNNFNAILRAITGLIPDTLRCTPPRNLHATADCNDVLLSWSPPGPEPQNEWIHYDGPYTGGNTGFSNAVSFQVAIRFDTAQLSAYHGLILDKIRFILGNKKAEYRINIWQGSDASDILVDEPLPGQIHMYWDDICGNHGQYWNTIILQEPLIIDATEELWIGYTCINLPGENARAGHDNNPSVPGYSDLLRINNGNWVSTHENYPSWDYNWSIQAFVTDINGNSLPLASGTFNIHQKAQQVKPGELISSCMEEVPSMVGYNLFRNGHQVNTEPLTELTYTDYDLPAGDYTYTLCALYEEGSSIPCGPSTVRVDELVLNPPYQLTATTSGNDVQLVWHEPLPPPIEQWLYYDNGENHTAVGMASGGTHSVAIRFLPDQLSGLDGMFISDVSLFPCANNTGYELFIARGPNANERLLTLPLDGLTIDEWNTITLSNPVSLDITKELWIGYKVINHPANDKGAGADSGPAIAGFGDMICIDGSNFVSLVSLNPDLSYNWNLRAFITNQFAEKHILATKSPADLQLLGYDVFRNNEKINNELLPSNSFSDTELPAGTYQYFVKSIYNQGTSLPSNIAEVTITLSVEEAGTREPVSIYTDPDGDFILIDAGNQDFVAELYNVCGSKVYQNDIAVPRLIIPAHNLKPGIYILRLGIKDYASGVKILIR